MKSVTLLWPKWEIYGVKSPVQRYGRRPGFLKAAIESSESSHFGAEILSNLKPKDEVTCNGGSESPHCRLCRSGSSPIWLVDVRRCERSSQSELSSTRRKCHQLATYTISALRQDDGDDGGEAGQQRGL